MEMAELAHLEKQINDLLTVLDGLQAENRHLRNQLARNARDKCLYYQNNRQLIVKIKKIISNLQDAFV